MRLEVWLNSVCLVSSSTRVATSLLLFTVVAFGLGCSNAHVSADDAVAELSPPPAEEELKKSLALVAQLFKNDIEAAKTPAQLQEVGKKLIQAGLETKDDPLGRFAALQLGAQFAARGGDVATASSAIDELAKTHKVDEWELKRGVADMATKAVRLPKQHEAHCSELANLIEASIAADRYVVARDLAEMLVRSAKSSRNVRLTKTAENLDADVKEIAAEHERLAAAIARYKAGEATVSDNLGIGQFLCLLKGDWSAGLPVLAAGSEGPLQQLAADELAGPTEAADQLALADLWWSNAEPLKGLGVRRARQRAAVWYERALPRLSGLSAAKAKKLIDAARQENEDHVLATTPTVRQRSSSSVVDLLAQCRRMPLAQQTVGGRWANSKDGIVSGETAYVRIALPYRVTKPYELDVEFKVVEPDAACVCLILPVGDRQTVLCMDGWGSRGSLTYLCNVNGREAPENPKAVRGKHLAKGTIHKARVVVDWNDSTSDARVSFQLDGRRIFEWRGKSDELSVQKGWELPKQDSLGLGTYTTQAEFRKVILVEE
jgi:hypothetical protein